MRNAQKGLTMNTNEITLRPVVHRCCRGQHHPSCYGGRLRQEIAKLDATNAKRAEKAARKGKENLPIKNRPSSSSSVANGTKTTAEIAKGVEVLEGSPKASAMCSADGRGGSPDRLEVSSRARASRRLTPPSFLRSNPQGVRRNPYPIFWKINLDV